MKSLISVIIPVYNSASTIAKALESVRKQTYGNENFEIIIINDGSSDDSQTVVEEYKTHNKQLDIKIISQENRGVSGARNSGLRIAKGDFIALLDSDDEWLPEKIEKQINYLHKNLEIDFLSCMRKNQKILYPYSLGKNNLAEITFNKLMIRNESQPSTVIFRRKVLENTGYFDENQRYAEDINYWLKISHHNKMYILGEILVIAGDGKRTFGVSGLSANLAEMEKGFQKNLKEMYFLKRINIFQYFLYIIFYKLKYISRIIRNSYLKFLGK